MSRKNILPPGPNPREDQMTEKDQEQLRRAMRGEGGEEENAEEFDQADLAEGERSAKPGRKVRHTPGQAEGDRGTEEEVKRD